MRKFWKYVHFCLSLPAGIVLIFSCLSGAVLVFQKDMQRLASSGCNPENGSVRVLPVDSLAHVALREVGREGKVMKSLTLYADSGHACEIGVEGQKGGYVMLDPCTAGVVGEGVWGEQFFASIRRLHRWLMLEGTGRDAGRLLTGISTLFFLFILISGLVMALPKRWAQWRQNLAMRRGKGSYTWWYTSHRALGLYCVLFLFLMASTGLMWSFDWYRVGVSKVLGMESVAEKSHSGSGCKGNCNDCDKYGRNGHHGGHGNPEANTVAWGVVWGQIQQGVQDCISVCFQGNTANVKTEKHHACGSDTYFFDEKGCIINVLKYEELPASRKMMDYVYLLHTGTWGGWFVKLLYCLACVGGVYLVISGYWLYCKRVFGKR